MRQTIQLPLQESEAFCALQTCISRSGAQARVSGCAEAAKLHLSDALSGAFRYTLIVTHSDLKAKELYEESRFFDRDAVYYPAKDLIFYQADVHGNEIIRERMRCLRALIEGSRHRTVVTTFAALMAPQLPFDTVRRNVLRIAKGDTVDLKELSVRLVTAGYEKAYQVEAPGQFSVRGDIIDVFDLTADNPCRIELWGDEVDTIRSFDILSQRSIEQMSEVHLYPATELILTEDQLYDGMERIEAEASDCAGKLRDRFETEAAHRLTTSIAELKEQLFELRMTVNLESYIRLFYDETGSFADLFPADDTLVVIDEPAHVLSHARAVETEFRESMVYRAARGEALPSQMDLLYGTEYCVAKLASFRRILFESLPMTEEDLFHTPDEKSFVIEARSIAPYNNSFEGLVRDLKRYRKEKYRVLILSGSRNRARRLVEDLFDNDITAFYSEDPSRVLQSGEIMTYYGHLRSGFAYPDIKFAVIAESDIFTERVRKKRRKKGRYKGEKIGSFADLKVGDYVVHEDHGLGIYRGIEQITSDGASKDYLKIEYAGGGNLYVQASALAVIQKYASGETSADGKAVRKPKLNRLGGAEWGRTRAKTQAAIDEVAQDLVELYAKRRSVSGYAFGQDTVWQQEFEDTFPYEETEDQENAIEAMKTDMESPHIMDRLICGDVGFGKTEIAIRGAFKAVQDSKQVAVLVPTTILAQQHYNTFVERMKDFPVRVDLLSRFRTPREQKKTVSDLKKGLVDIVIGTHRLLSKDVGYKDLGLLVVDEEQRFGVSHKEKIKQLKESVDVLTLTATPIPRTLNMSLIGIRDMSLLTEAPNDRLPIQTFVCEHNDEMVREAIVREVKRGGQVYYVYNRVDTIADITARISQLVPQARIAFAHGQMAEAELERIMYDFIAGEIDVLVSTTIIETGLDIPNVNTMIIHDSDRMGLAQLYQLRGRVGRSNRTAYAFLMYKRGKLLKEVAEKRLTAIREFTDLGSGYKIAMRDLEIRGAGNLLGKKQSGHMAAVGFDLYCKMLEESVQRMTGREVNIRERLQTSVDLNVNAFIPDIYILNEVQKLEIYKRIAVIADGAEASDMRDELKDRFGEVPVSVDNLIRISLIRERASKLGITEIKSLGGEINFVMREDAPINVAGIPSLIASFGKKLAFYGAGTPTFTWRLKKMLTEEDAEKAQLEVTEGVLSSMEKYIGA